MISAEGSVRIDLLGGTIDLFPINLIIPNVVTLNAALSLTARVEVEAIDLDGIEIVSKDYNSVHSFSSENFSSENLNNGHFSELTFICQILDYFNCCRGVRLTLESDAPPGSGLGGSSSMGVTLYRALCKFKQKNFDCNEAITRVGRIESRILNRGPAGYQDYYPAMFGGVLALFPNVEEIKVEQLFSVRLKDFLEGQLTLVYSKESRNSGINNWEVYKGFFDNTSSVRDGLYGIADLSLRAFHAIKEERYDELLELISKEGDLRKNLFPGIMTERMEDLYCDLKKDFPNLGIKVCGAGGGGCFLLVHDKEDKSIISKKVKEKDMQILNFSLSAPL